MTDDIKHQDQASPQSCDGDPAKCDHVKNLSSSGSQNSSAISAENMEDCMGKSLEKLSNAFMASARRWEMIVYPALVAFIILAAYGFYLIYSLTTDISEVTKDMHKITITMERVAGNMDSISQNMSSISQNMVAMTATLDGQSKSMHNMEYQMRGMNMSIAQMRNDMSNLNQNVGRPMSFMNNFIPW